MNKTKKFKNDKDYFLYRKTEISMSPKTSAKYRKKRKIQTKFMYASKACEGFTVRVDAPAL